MSISKAFILGAGLGTRLRPLTNVLPKPLVPLWNEPLVYHVLRHCQQAGINSFAINTHHLPETWNAYFPSNSFEGSPVELFHEPTLLETGGGIKNIESFIDDSPILICNGDIISDLDLTGLIKTHTNSNNIATLAVQSTGPNCNVAVEAGQVTDIRNALGIHPGNHQFTGIYCISPKILQLIPANEKISVVPAFLELAKQGKIGAFNADKASWIDIGTIENYREAHEQSDKADPKGNYLSPKAQVGENCKLTNSIIWPEAILEANTSLENCIVYSSRPVSSSHINQLL